jgi:hypothetical protein
MKYSDLSLKKKNQINHFTSNSIKRFSQILFRPNNQFNFGILLLLEVENHFKKMIENLSKSHKRRKKNPIKHSNEEQLNQNFFQTKQILMVDTIFLFYNFFFY